MQRESGTQKFWFIILVAMFVLQEGIAQDGQTVQEGQMYGLGVIPIAGGTYFWHVFKDHTLQTEADTSEVVFPSGNEGSSVPVVWLKSGLYYFTVSAENERGCSNLKVGMITVDALSMLLPTIRIRLDKNPVCAGTKVRFWALTTNQGLDAKFRWYKNGRIVGTDWPNYSDSTLADNDRISCIMTQLPTRSTDDPLSAQSNELIVTVYTTEAGFSIREKGGGSTGSISLINQSTGADEYDWDLGNGFSSMLENPEISYTEDGIYLIRLVARKVGYCADTAEIKYRMMFKGLYIPNAFAPGATTGLPGVFKPAGINLKRFKIEIFDNWGHPLWQSTALDESGIPTESWDGTYLGRLMPQDTYLWKAEAEFTDGTVWEGSDIGKGAAKTIGTVTLLR